MACMLFNLSLNAIWLLSSWSFWHAGHPIVAAALLAPPLVRAGRSLATRLKRENADTVPHSGRFARQQSTASPLHRIGNPIAGHVFNEKVSVPVEADEHLLRHVLRDARRAPNQKHSA